MAQQIEAEFKSADLDQRRLAMLRYAVKLTISPAKMQHSDVQSLKAAGFTDLDILHIAEAVAYYAYVNRLADGLGVALEKSSEKPHHA